MLTVSTRRPRFVVVKKAGGSLHLYRQCIHCGVSIGTALKRSPEFDHAADWDAETEARFRAERKSAYAAIIQEHVRRQREGKEGFWREYTDYLKSEAWAKRRAAVLKRANGRCEGCLEKPATQVHHLSYAHVFHEFLFELVAICDECHDRIHLDDDNETESSVHPCGMCRWADEERGRWWCNRFKKSARQALAVDGECGPDQYEYSER